VLRGSALPRDTRTLSSKGENMNKKEKLAVIVALYYEMCSHFIENNRMTKKQYVKMKNKAKKNPFDLSIMKPVNQKFIYKFVEFVNFLFYDSEESKAWSDCSKFAWGMMHDTIRHVYQDEFPSCTIPLYRQQEIKKWNDKVLYRNGKHDIYGNRK
jgi:hypothetical protein